MDVNNFVEVAKVNDISPGHMKHLELYGKEILIANVEGRFYAMDDRCGHMNALLSMGNFKDTTLTCGFHAAQFDVTTGKKIGEPKLESPQEMEPLPQSWQKYFQYVSKMMAPIKTYDQTAYEIRVEGDKIRIKI